MFFCCRRRKILPGCMVGLGIGIILVLFLPLEAWLCLIGICLIASGIGYLFGR